MNLQPKAGRVQLILIGLVFLTSSTLWAESGSSQLAAAEIPDLPPVSLPVPSAVGSSAANLSKSANGTIVLSWLESAEQGASLRFSHLTDGGWSIPRTAAEGDNWFVNWADFPSVVAVSERLWAAHWLQKVPGGTYAYHVNIALSQDAGESWGAAITPHRDNTPTEHGFVSLFPSEQGVGAIWLDGRNTIGTSPGHAHDEGHGGGGMTLRSAVILPSGEITAETEMDALVCDCCQTSVAVARQGPVAVYRNRTEAEIRDIYLSRSIAQQWQAGHPVHDDGWKISGCPVNGPAVAASGDTVVVAWFTLAEDIPRVRFARSEDGGASFPQVLDIAENSPTGRVDVALLDDGTAAISWLDELQENGQETAGANPKAPASTLLRIQVILADGSLGPSHLLYGSRFKRAEAVLADGRPETPQTWFGNERSSIAGFPQMVSDGNALVVAWTSTVGSTTKVFAARIPLTGPDIPDSSPANP